MNDWLTRALQPYGWDDEQEEAAHLWYAQLSDDAKARLELMVRVNVAVAQRWMAPGGAAFLRDHFVVAADIRAERTARLRSVGDRSASQGIEGKRNALRSLVRDGWIKLLSSDLPHHLGQTFAYLVEVDAIADLPLFAQRDLDASNEQGHLPVAIPSRMWAARYPGLPCRHVPVVVARLGSTPCVEPSELATPRASEEGP